MELVKSSKTNKTTELVDSSKINNSSICIYHRKSDIFHCPDGIFAAYVFNLFHKPDIFIAGTHYNNDEIIEKIGANNYVVMLDYSMKSHQLDLINEKNDIRVIDHHAGAVDQILNTAGSLDYYFSVSNSGAVLTWKKYFPGEKTPEILKYIESGDLYKFDLPESKKVCAGLYTLIHHSFSFEEVFENISKYFNYSRKQLIAHFLPIGEAEIFKNQKRIADYCDKAYPQKIQNHNCLVVEVTKYDLDIVSKIGYNLYSQVDDVDFIVIANQGDDKCYVSFRSSGFDCLPIAQSFGGNGHPQACGCSVRILDLLFDKPE
jgi:hypothetical protein